jgi:AraC family transcriptional regulator of adaptative response/methylated-DNA-[protein]-cysteine methyltransferase
LEAVTPQEYKLKGEGIKIDYGFHETPFGLCLIGVTDRGICWLSFLNNDEDNRNAVETMKEHWFNSVFHADQELTGHFIHRVFGGGDASTKLHLFVKGTNFQIKVWNALLKISRGNVITYQTIAESIKNPKALQAVGSAVGSNHIAYLIPCHRVIRKDGILGEYRWNPTRKKSMIGWEMARSIID